MKTTTKPAPAPKTSKAGFPLYPTYDRNGKLIYVSVPDAK